MTSPIEIVGDIARAAICAPPGHRLLIGDFSGIESRALAWIADEHGKIKLWETFDRTQSADDDPYTVIGRSLGHPEATARQKGKIADLAFGYQGGAGAYKNFAPENDTATDAEIEAHKKAWRARHPQVEQFWWGIDRAAIAAVHQPARPVRYGRLNLHCEPQGPAVFLFITLPSGRRLAYPFAKLMTNRFGRAAVTFMDNALGQWKPCNHDQGAYGGLWTENIVSGIARDLLAAAMTRLEAAAYPVVLHVHDEIGVELPNKEGSLDEFKYLIERLPEWAKGLPVAAKVRNGPRFAEVDAPVVHVAGATAVPLMKPRAVRKAATVDLGPATVYPPIAEVSLESDDPRGRLAAWVLEREAIRLRRELGRPPPWTTDPILAVGRFCNVYREHDKGTRYVTTHIVEPHRNDPDLWFAITLARCVNEPDALGEILPHLLPFDAGQCREILQARQARGKKVFRTDAYKPPTPDRKGVGTAEFVIQDVLGPMWREREALRPREGESLTSYSDRLEQCYKIGPFLAAQVIADLKHVEPLKSAPDWWEYARPGPGSERGLNRVRRRSVNASWSEAKWHRELMQLHAETAELFKAAGLAPLDAQNLQNCLCEFDKWERAREKDGKPARLYKHAAQPKPKPTKQKPVKEDASTVESLPSEPEPVAADPNEPPDYIREDVAQRDAAKSQPKAQKVQNASATSERKANGSGYPRGERDTGREEAFYIYQDARGRNYGAVKRMSTKQFPQYHWDGTQWQKGAPSGPKIPYRLPELLDAKPDAWVVIAAGEKDALTAAALGFVATTNPGGEGKGQWTPELNRWFTGKQRAAIMEDNDDTGKAHAIEVANALRGAVPDLRIVGFRELKPGGDLTDWIEADRTRGQAELLARIEATESARTELEEWDAGELLSGPAPEPRQWLTARYFCRSFLSGLVAPGDAGKTTLRLTQAIELATGRELLGQRIHQRARVLVLCFEDDRDELHRRLKAICKHYDIAPGELKGWLFCRNLKKVKLAELDSKGRRPQVGALDAMLRRAIERGHYDLVVLDPFVKLHALLENDNAAMDFVCELLIDIAQTYNIAVDCPAHTHKGAIVAGDADARRGASAQRDAGRLDYTLTVMSEVEAKQFGISADERKSYVRLDKAKANIARVMKAAWFRLVSVRLDNATTLYPDGDEVQAIERWTPPETWAGVEPETLDAILNEIEAGMTDGQRYSNRGRVAGRAAWRAVRKHCPTKVEAQCREIIKQWINAGVLFEKNYNDPKSRKPVFGLYVDPGKRPE